jgi:hypothetical protein
LPPWKRFLSEGKEIYTTTCLNCNFTCHDNCAFSDDSDKKDCAAMNRDGYCENCPGKCYWQQHKNVPYILLKKKRKVKKTLELLIKAYYDSGNNLNVKQQILNGLQNDLDIQMYQCMKLLNQVQLSVERLKEIALNKKIHESSIQYIDQLIKSEKIQKKPGYLERIQSLDEIKKRHKIISDLYKSQETSSMKDLDKFTEEYINSHSQGNMKIMSYDKNCCIF